jgi:hypothetical protein
VDSLLVTGQSALIMWLPFSAIMMVAAFVFPALNHKRMPCLVYFFIQGAYIGKFPLRGEGIS